VSDIVVVALISAGASIIAAAAGVVAAIVSVRGNRKTDALEVKVDGRLTELLESAKQKAYATGQLEGRAAADARTDVLAEKTVATHELLKAHDSDERKIWERLEAQRARGESRP
jgi:hypothetical protein